MIKNVFFTAAAAAAAAALIAGANIAAPLTAQAMTCQDAAKMKYPESMKERMMYKRDCKKAFKASEGKEGPLTKMRMKSSS